MRYWQAQTTKTLNNQTSKVQEYPGLYAVALLFVHIPLGYAMHQSREIATVHAGAVILYSVFRALTCTNAVQLAALAAYITGAEVLWRMCKAHIFWETGKYAVIAVLLLHGLRFSRRREIWPWLYVILLLPAVIPTFLDLDFSQARMYVSFNLSGPLSLAVCLWFFLGMNIRRTELWRIGLYLVAPVLGVATVTVFSTYFSRDITFRMASNFATTGGFGPNQVAAILALGFVFTFLMLFLKSSKYRLLTGALYLLLPLLLAQSAMTFSRTGPYLALGSILFGSLFLFTDRRARLGLAAGAGILLVAANFYVLPALDSFTSGMLETRYREMNTSNRVAILEEELDVWAQYPLVGVGLGMARFYRGGFDDAASHTEFSRILAEHGLPGLAAMLLLCWAMARNFMTAREPLGKAIAVALMAFFVGFLLVSGMRLVAPSLALGLAFAVLAKEDSLRGGRIAGG